MQCVRCREIQVWRNIQSEALLDSINKWREMKILHQATTDCQWYKWNQDICTLPTDPENSYCHSLPWKHSVEFRVKVFWLDIYKINKAKRKDGRHFKWAYEWCKSFTLYPATSRSCLRCRPPNKIHQRLIYPQRNSVAYMLLNYRIFTGAVRNRRFSCNA